GASCSLFHSIHNRVATISQAKIRNTRVWFMGSRQAHPPPEGGVGSVKEGTSERRDGGIVPSAPGDGNEAGAKPPAATTSIGSAPARCNSPRKAVRSCWWSQ